MISEVLGYHGIMITMVINIPSIGSEFELIGDFSMLVYKNTQLEFMLDITDPWFGRQEPEK